MTRFTLAAVLNSLGSWNLTRDATHTTHLHTDVIICVTDVHALYASDLSTTALQKTARSQILTTLAEERFLFARVLPFMDVRVKYGKVSGRFTSHG